MFIHNLKYAMKTMFKNKTAIMWTLLFPMALGTFMYMAFGNVYEQEAVFKVIPVAVVKTAENEAFQAMLDELGRKGDGRMLEVKYLEDKEAKNALNEEKVNGIIYMGKEIKLMIKDNSYASTILKTVLDEYKKQETVLTDVSEHNPQALSGAIENLISEESFFTERSTSNGNQDMFTNYFYAIFAMSCLFASFGAVEKIGKLQANVSGVGIRRCLSPNSKMLIIVAEFLSMLIMQFVIEVIVLIYFVAIGVDFGERYPQIIIILFLGSCIGIAFGIIIGSVSKFSENTKSGICVLVSMALSVLADLVINGIKDVIEHTAPIINRINPAALIVDSFYSLNIYVTYDRYIKNMMTLGVMTVLLLAVSFLILRRNKYASV